MRGTCSPRPLRTSRTERRLPTWGLRSRRRRWPRCELAEPLVEPGKITCEVLDLNRFGNVQLNVRSSQLAAAGLDRAERILVETPAGGGAVARTVATYADLSSGEWGLMVDPRGWLSVICGNPVNAAQSLGVAGGEVVWLSVDRGQDG